MSSNELTGPAANDARDLPALATGFEALDDLMKVVEALCPIWPERPLFLDQGRCKL